MGELTPSVRQVPKETHSHDVRAGTRRALLCRWAATPELLSVCHHPPVNMCMCVSLRKAAGEKEGSAASLPVGGEGIVDGRGINTLKKRTLTQSSSL